MKVDLIRAGELGAVELARWEEIRAASPSLSSPYFSPHFTLAASEARGRTWVSVLREGSRIVGFFPFELKRRGMGRPVGGSLSDYHGLVVADPEALPIQEVMAGSHLSTWTFNHLLASQTCFDRYSRARSCSPVIELKGGYAGYEEDRARRGSKVIQRTLAKSRKIARERGDAIFSFSSADGRDLERVLSWKSAQCRRSRARDYFALAWNRNLVWRIHEHRTGDFQGVLSTLRVGDVLLSAHFGMRSGSTLHWWFPVYNRAFAAYRPGQVLLLDIIRHAGDEGIDLVDLGKGDDHYKSRFQTGSIDLLEGRVYGHSAKAMAYWIRDGTETFLRHSPAVRPVRSVVRSLRGSSR